jgi:HSP20 family molecular chaperone IbpA
MEIPIRIINTEQVNLKEKTFVVPQQTFERKNVPQIMTELATTDEWTKIISTEDMIGQQLPSLKSKHMNVEIDQFLRCVIIKVPRQHMTKYQLTQPFRQVLQVPEFVDIHKVKVILCNENNVVIVTAPRTALEQYNQQTPTWDQRDQLKTLKVQQNVQLLKEQNENETEVVEYEPKIYKIMKNLRKSLPQNMFVPRCVVNQQTGLYNIHLDTQLTGFQSEHVQIVLDDLENVLVILAKKTDKDLFYNTKQTQKGFYPKSLRHDIQLPKFIVGKKISWFKLNDNTVRIRLPIDQFKQMF